MTSFFTNLNFKYTGKTDVQKSAYLIKVICVIHLLVLPFIVLLGGIFDERLVSIESLIGYFVLALVICLVWFLEAKGILTFAKWLLVCVSVCNTILFDKYILPSYGIKYYYIIPTLFSLFIFRKLWVSHLFFLVSILLFFNVFQIFIDVPFDRTSIHFISYFLVLYLIVLMSVRANRNSEISLNEKNKKQERVQEVKNRFFSQVAHEIKTPITILSGNAKLIYDGIENPTTNQIEEFNEVTRQQNKIQRIIDDVLDLERMKEDSFNFNKTVLDMNELVKRTMDSFKTVFNTQNIQINLSTSNEAILFNGSSIYLERMLNNLLSNAVKFSPNNSGVSLSVRNKINTCIIEISDQGIGIPEEDLERVFDHFYQSPNEITSSSGSGIGLAYCKRIIELHGGKIKIKQNPEKGVTVCVFLPLEKELELNLPVNNQLLLDSNNPAPFTKSKAKILVVDDQLEIRTYLKKVLLGYEVFEAENGKVAVEELRKTSFDVVITDLMMPEMDGLQLLQHIKQKEYDTGVIMLTAKTSVESRISALRIGVDDYIHKPFEHEELLLRIEYLIQNQRNRIPLKIEPEIEEVPQRNNFLEQVQEVLDGTKSLENFKITDLADQLNISQSTLLRNIKSFTGQTAKQYLKEAGLQRARIKYETNNNLTIKSLAIEAGMKNQTYFTKEFYIRFGIDLKKK